MKASQLRDMAANGSAQRSADNWATITSKNGKEQRMELDDIVDDWAVLCRQNAALEAEAKRYRMHITEKRYVNACPDNELPIRILEAHLDYSEVSDNLEGLEPTNWVCKEMNEAQKKRNEILESVIGHLKGWRDER